MRKLQDRVTVPTARLLALLDSYERRGNKEVDAHARFDNRPTWDNWPNGPANPFDNRPTWDNWDKR
jgi:hypothetical protein